MKDFIYKKLTANYGCLNYYNFENKFNIKIVSKAILYVCFLLKGKTEQPQRR